MKVEILTALKDNYIYVLHEGDFTAVVDPSEAAPVLAWLQSKKINHLDLILTTHHHHDHVGGNLELQKKYGCAVICSKYDFNRVPGATRAVGEGDLVRAATKTFQVLEVPGHTLGAIAYYSADAELVFTGDTLFTLGCGRLFEGSPDQMWQSLKRLGALPAPTQVYSGHEYGLQNAGFAAAMQPQKTEVQTYFNSLKTSQSRSVPSNIGQERLMNPFLSAQDAPDFARLRQLKDDFRLEDTHPIR